MDNGYGQQTQENGYINNNGYGQQAQENGYGNNNGYGQQTQQAQNTAFNAQYNQFNKGVYPQSPGNAPDYMTWLVLGVVQIILICCCNCAAFVCGILTVMFVMQGNSAYKMGDSVTYNIKMKHGKIANIIGWLLMVANFIITFVGGIFDIITSLFL